MSTAIIQAEIERFLKSPMPEVLCISGRWGVGKTFAWQRYYQDVEAAGKLALKRYAYVSLFGINSLADLRAAIVENSFLADELSSDQKSFSWRRLRHRGDKLVRLSRPLLDVVASTMGRNGVSDALYRAAFRTIKNQLICFDDLERAGDGLDLKDVLGLTSMLREQRGCKVVLLLNREQVNEAQSESFGRQFEKVVDIHLEFEPTSAEAVAIAVYGTDFVAITIRDRIQTLGITNIRIIKKIERWARQLESLLVGYEDVLKKDALATLVIAGWSFLQQDDAPPLDFLKSYNSITGIFDKKEMPDEERKWRKIVTIYGYGSTNEFDKLIIDGIAVGYFRETELKEAASKLQEQMKRSSDDDSFSKAWKLYHHSLTVDDEIVLDAMFDGALENLNNITLLNINSTVAFLRRYGRESQASEIVSKYVEANEQNLEQILEGGRLFITGPVDEELSATLERRRKVAIDTRDPAEVLLAMASSKGLNPTEDVPLFSKLEPDELIKLFHQLEGGGLGSIIEWADRLASQPGADVFRANLTTALKTIAEQSPMRAGRLRQWGVLPDGADKEP